MDYTDIFNATFDDVDYNGYQGQTTTGSVPDQTYYSPVSETFSGMPPIPETTYSRFQSAPYTRPTMGSPFSYESQSSGHRTSSTFSTPMSSSSDQSNFLFGNRQPARSFPRQSLLTTKLQAQPQMNPNDFIVAQSGSPMISSPTFTSSPNVLGSPDITQFSPMYAHLQPPLNAYNLDKDQVVSRQFDTPLIPMQQDAASPITDGFPSPSETALHHSQAIPIKRPARHLSISGSARSPYSRESTTLSPRSELSSSLMGGSFTATPSMGHGFSQEQVPAAQAILQFISDHPRESIPSHLITDRLVEISSGRGYCLIGNCGVERAMQKCNPEYDASKDTASRKRVDHLYDHVKDKHFNWRPFQCDQCPRAFSRDHDLKRHHETVHNRTSWICQTCFHTYTREDNLKRHVAQKHPEVIAAQGMP